MLGLWKRFSTPTGLDRITKKTILGDLGMIHWLLFDTGIDGAFYCLTKILVNVTMFAISEIKREGKVVKWLDNLYDSTFGVISYYK